MSWPRSARCWSADEIAADVAAAAAEFRRRRLGEPLARYLEAFDAAAPAVRTLLGQLADALRDGEAERWRTLWASDAGRVAFRYVLVRLDDGRLLAIECKGSNSAINSRKRLNKEAAHNARAWLQRFGGEVVPAVALQGVFNARYVAAAQATPLLVFWGHRLEDRRDFVAAAV